MPVKIFGDEDNNIIEISKKFLSEGSGSIHLNGIGSRIVIKDPLASGSIYCTIGSGASISIGESCVLGSMVIHAVSERANIKIGSHVGFNGLVSIAAHEPSLIEIGDGCLLASECMINSSDVHHIFDNDTGNRLNPASDIIIERHVWLASRVMVMKGARIGADSVVGAGSIVTGCHEPNTLIAGSPARLIRKNINWRH